MRYIEIFYRDYSCSTRRSLNTVIAPNTHVFIDIPSENCGTSMKDSYINLELKVSHYKVPHGKFENADLLRLVEKISCCFAQWIYIIN